MLPEIGRFRTTPNGVLYPTFGILLSLVVAALAMSLSSVPVIANVLRLRATPL